LSQLRQRFEGPSIEDALAAAVDQYGPQVSVSDARRVRTGGVLGFFARERYQVSAAPGADPAHAQARIDDTLRGLVDAVESDGRAPSFARVLAATVDPPTVVGAPPPEANAPALYPGGTTDAWVDGLASFLERPEPMVDISERAVASAHTAPSAAVSIPALAPPRALPAAIVGEPAWSRDSLRELGVPSTVLSRLPAEDPDTDLDWTAALGRAIAAVVPTSARLGDEAPVVVSGYGREAAVGLLRAGADGFVPGVLLIDGNEVPATPTELALGVRACLPR
jgi:hypothetical protein